MKFIFEETGDTREAFRFGGRLTLKAEGIDDAAILVDHFKIHQGRDIESLQGRIAALQDPNLSHTIGTEKRPAYEVESCLGHEFSAPYEEWMSRALGYGGSLPDIQIPRKWDGLQHTNYKAELYLFGGHICFKAYTESAPWNKKDAHTHAESVVVDCIQEEFGDRRREPEFITAGTLMKPNPDYLRRHKPHPSASNDRLKRALFGWWLDTQANDAQREVVKGNAAIVAETGDYMSAFRFERHESHIDYGRKYNAAGETSDYLQVSFDEFAQLGKATADA